MNLVWRERGGRIYTLELIVFQSTLDKLKDHGSICKKPILCVDGSEVSITYDPQKETYFDFTPKNLAGCTLDTFDGINEIHFRIGEKEYQKLQNRIGSLIHEENDGRIIVRSYYNPLY